MRKLPGFQLFRGVVEAICATIAEAGPAVPSLPRPAPSAAVSEYVIASVEQMPRLFALGIHLLTLYLAVGGIVYGRSFFHRNPVQARGRQWASWRDHRVPMLRDFVRFYESLAILARFSGPDLPAQHA